jgi:hypothetical protein
MHLRSTRISTIALAIAAALAIPAAAQAKPQTATVLRVDRAHHRIELVNSSHVVHAYAVAGKLLRRVARGSVVSFSVKGKRVTKLRLKGRAHKLAFYGTVVASGKRNVVLQLADGRRVRLGTKAKAKAKAKAQAARAAGTVSIQLVGLKPGQTVLITESFDANGNVTITIKLVQGADPNGGGSGGSGGDDTPDQDAVGTVTAIAADGSTITIQVDGQGAMTFQADADLVSGFNVGDAVDVTYYTDTDGSLVADDVESTDNSGGGSDSGA